MSSVCAKRVAIKYANSIKNKKFPLPITYEESYSSSRFGNHLFLGFQYQGSDVGRVSGIFIESGEVSDYECEDDLLTLSASHPEVSNFGAVRTLTIHESDLSVDFRNTGLGLQMYEEYLRTLWDKVRVPFIAIPDECDDGETSLDAKRVWKSLARKYPSSNLCFAILKRP